MQPSPSLPCSLTAAFVQPGRSFFSGHSGGDGQRPRTSSEGVSRYSLDNAASGGLLHESDKQADMAVFWLFLVMKACSHGSGQ